MMFRLADRKPEHGQRVVAFIGNVGAAAEYARAARFLSSNGRDRWQVDGLAEPVEARSTDHWRPMAEPWRERDAADAMYVHDLAKAKKTARKSGLSHGETEEPS